jgi:hypothetical protein
MKKISEFSFKIRLTPKRSLIAVAVASSLAFLNTQCNIQKEHILKLYNEIRKILPIGKTEFLREFDNQLNERIIKDPKLLDYKVRGEVDYAIYNYEREEQKNRTINMKNKNILEEINKDKYDQLQKLIVENAVYYEFADGTMGIRGAWVDPDPREVDLEH